MEYAMNGTLIFARGFVIIVHCVGLITVAV